MVYTLSVIKSILNLHLRFVFEYFAKKLKKMYSMVLHLEFVIWTTWQMRGANLAKMPSCRRLSKPDRPRLETFYFYPLSSPNVNSLRDDLFLSFAFCYGSLQTTTNVKLICQSLWRLEGTKGTGVTNKRVHLPKE